MEDQWLEMMEPIGFHTVNRLKYLISWTDSQRNIETGEEVVKEGSCAVDAQN